MAEKKSEIKTHAQIMLPFLLDYPMGKKLVTKNFHFLVSNLDYEYESGRESVLLMLESVLAKVLPYFLKNCCVFQQIQTPYCNTFVL